MRDAISNAIVSGMKTSIDKAGRVIIPKTLRLKAELKPGTELDVRYENGRIVLEPSEGRIRIVKRGRFYVAVSDDTLPRMTTEDVEELRAAVSRERGIEE